MNVKGWSLGHIVLDVLKKHADTGTTIQSETARNRIARDIIAAMRLKNTSDD